MVSQVPLDSESSEANTLTGLSPFECRLRLTTLKLGFPETAKYLRLEKFLLQTLRIHLSSCMSDTFTALTK